MPADQFQPATGNGYLIYIDKNADNSVSAIPDWQLVAGQTGAKLSLKQGTADVTTKDSQNWKELIYTNREWTLALDALIELGDQGFDLLQSMFDNQLKKKVLIVFPDDTRKQGMALLSAFELDGPQGAAAKAIATFEGTGALTAVVTAP